MAIIVRSQASSPHDEGFLDAYAAFHESPHEVQLLCDDEGRVVRISGPASIIESFAGDADGFEHLGHYLHEGLSLFEKVKGCSIRTQLAPTPPLLSRFTVAMKQQEKLEVGIFPVFQSTSSQPLYQVAIKIPEPPCDSWLPNSRRFQGPESFPFVLIDTQTELILEANAAFAKATNLPVEQLRKTRLSELGLGDLLMQATLYKDRRSLFRHNLPDDWQYAYWVGARSNTFEERECLEIAFFPSEGCAPCAPDASSPGLDTSLAIEWRVRPRKILICDDNALLLQTCTDLMSQIGIHHVTAQNGKEALWLLENQSFDIVFLDLNMPLLNGFDTARIIRQSQRAYARIPIIAMTAIPFANEKDEPQLKHFDAFLRKPFELDDIRKAIERAVEKFEFPLALMTHAHDPSLSSKKDSTPLFQPTSFMIRFARQTPILERLRQASLEKWDTLASAEPRDYASLNRLREIRAIALNFGAERLVKRSDAMIRHLRNHPGVAKDDALAEYARCFEDTRQFAKTMRWAEWIPVTPSTPEELAGAKQ